MMVSRRKTSSSAIMLAATICTVVSSSFDSASAFVQPVRRSHAVRSIANLNDSISPLDQYNYKRALPKTAIATPLYMSSTNGDDAKN